MSEDNPTLAEVNRNVIRIFQALDQKVDVKEFHAEMRFRDEQKIGMDEDRRSVMTSVQEIKESQRFNTRLILSTIAAVLGNLLLLGVAIALHKGP